MRLVVSLVSMLCLALVAPSFVSANRANAARMFQEAEQLGEAGRHREAAELYEAAYALVPASVALVAAAHERGLAEDWDALIVHLAALERMRDDPEAFAVIAELEASLLRVRTSLLVRCEIACSVATDRHAPSPVATEHRLWLVPGRVTTLWARFEGGGIVERALTLAPGRQSITIAPALTTPSPSSAREPDVAPAPPTPSDDRAPARRMRPALLVATAGTIVLDGVALWALATAAHARRTYAASPSPEGFDDAVSAQRRATGVGICALAATTATVSAIVLVRARDRVAITPTVDVARGAVVIGLSGSF